MPSYIEKYMPIFSESFKQRIQPIINDTFSTIELYKNSSMPEIIVKMKVENEIKVLDNSVKALMQYDNILPNLKLMELKKFKDIEEFKATLNGYARRQVEEFIKGHTEYLKESYEENSFPENESDIEEKVKAEVLEKIPKLIYYTLRY